MAAPPTVKPSLSPETFSPDEYRELLREFLKEDLGAGDWTTEQIVPADHRAQGQFEVRVPLVLAGIGIAIETMRLLDADLETIRSQRDGEKLTAGDIAAQVRGRARALLSGERVALNLLQRLSGIATLTRTFVEAVAGTGAEIVDTRKTTPGLRALERYAVRVGGGRNHRLNLGEAMLIKDNHICVAGGVAKAIRLAAPGRARVQWLEVEVTNLAELAEALNEHPDSILLDNFSPELAREAAERVRRADPKGAICIEASGGIGLGNVRQYAEAGVQWISVGALTHSAPAMDISFEMEVDDPGATSGENVRELIREETRGKKRTDRRARARERVGRLRGGVVGGRTGSARAGDDARARAGRKQFVLGAGRHRLSR